MLPFSFSISFRVPLQTPQTKANAKKRMAAELTSLSNYLNELERERLEAAELHEQLLQSVEEMSHKKQKLVESMDDQQEVIEKEYRKTKSEYLKVKRERDGLQEKLDSIVSQAWKKHVHSVQASDWFSDFERGFF